MRAYMRACARVRVATGDGETAAAHGERLLWDPSPAHKYCIPFSLSAELSAVQSARASPADTRSSFPLLLPLTPIITLSIFVLWNYSPRKSIIISTGQNSSVITYTDGRGRHCCGIITRNNFSHLFCLCLGFIWV